MHRSLTTVGLQILISRCQGKPPPTNMSKTGFIFFWKFEKISLCLDYETHLGRTPRWKFVSAVFLVCELNSYLTLCSRQLFVPGELLQLVTHAVKDICEFQLIKHSSALLRPDSEPVAVFDVCLWWNWLEKDGWFQLTGLSFVYFPPYRPTVHSAPASSLQFLIFSLQFAATLEQGVCGNARFRVNADVLVGC